MTAPTHSPAVVGALNTLKYELTRLSVRLADASAEVDRISAAVNAHAARPSVEDVARVTPSQAEIAEALTPWIENDASGVKRARAARAVLELLERGDG